MGGAKKGKKMTKEELDQVESSQRQHFEVLLHQDKQSLIVEQLEMNLFAMLKPKVFQDVNQFCVLYGEDLQSGIAGFGDTIRLAIYDFNKQFDKKAKNAPQNTVEAE